MSTAESASKTEAPVSISWIITPSE